LLNILTGNGRFPSITLVLHRRPFPTNISSFHKTYNSLWRFMPITLAEQNGRSPPKPLAISKSLNDQPAPQLPKPAPKPDRCAAK
jgi:hypothetical protein